MSKSGKVSYNPSGTFYLNGENKASTNVTPGGVYSYYNMSDTEKQAYDYAQKEFAKNLSQINVFSEETQKELQDVVDNFIELGTKDINEIYEPILNDLQNDIASRFGNLDNSIFMDNLKSVEQNRADAITDLALEAELLSNDLINNELANRYDFLDYLNSYQQQVNDNVLETLGFTTNASNLSTNHYNRLNSNKRDSLSDITNVAYLATKLLAL